MMRYAAAAELSVDGKPVDVREFFNLLESNNIDTVQDIQHLIQDNLSSTKEPWLVHSLVDYYYISHSDTAADILTEVREPHYKFLVDKLNDGVRSVEHRLYAVKLILYIVCKQPIWIHKIVTQPVFSAIIKCLKTETDIPVLATAVLVITVLLPSVPSLMNQHLADIFEIFSRLLGFNSKQPGNVPVVFLLYLQVALYSLFHRLYGMYPANFLTYLKNYYCKKENMGVYEEFVKMETQDILIECCRMSLDPVEGSWEDTHCPVLSPHYTLYRSIMDKDKSVTHHPETPSKDNKTFNQSLPQNDLSPFNNISAVDMSTLCSPSMVIGLSTPPPSQRNTPATSFLETSANFQQSFSGTYGNTPLMTPPAGTPRATPPVTDDLDKNKTSSKGSSQKDVKRPTAGGKSLPGLVIPTVSNPSSVPPSPLKTEFTALPPIGTMKSLPVRQSAARELCFDSITENKSETHSKTATEGVDIIQEGEKNQEEEGFVEMEKDAGCNRATEVVGSFPIDTLPQLVEGLDSQVTDMVDDEVSEITQVDHDPEVTAESVAQFMKSVNRIRFNSLSNNVEELLGEKKFTHRLRSRSCPQLPKLVSPDFEGEDHEPLSRSISSTFKGTFQPTEENLEEEEPETENVVVSLTKEETPLYNFASKTKTVGCDTDVLKNQTSVVVQSSFVNPSVSSTIDKQEQSESIKVFNLLKTLMLPTFSHVCQKCRNEIQSDKQGTEHKTGPGVPVFSTFSPPELLDKHIQSGEELHAKELSKIPMTSKDSISWTHFGGTPPADETNILKGQILMIQNQLLYERHKRELHSKRNRRLLRKIVNAQAQEEQNSAMETEIQNLNVSLKILNEEKRRLTENLESNEYQKKCELRTLQQENHDLRSTKTELTTLLVTQREEQDLLRKVPQLHKELLLMGELQQKYQEKLQATKLSHNAKSEQEYHVATLRAEIKVLKAQLEHKKIQLDATLARTEELEEVNKVRALEEKYQNSIKVNQQLESHIIQLYSQIYQKPAASVLKEESSSQRERTESDPTVDSKQPHKKPLSKLSSVPLHCNMDSDSGGQQSKNLATVTASYGHSYSQEEIDSDIMDREGTSTIGTTNQHEADTASVSSRESGLFHLQSRTSTLSYSEGEDRSNSSRGMDMLDDLMTDLEIIVLILNSASKWNVSKWKYQLIVFVMAIYFHLQYFIFDFTYIINYIYNKIISIVLMLR
ncbi:hypothetical protein KUTeg_022236 [Tegillarca granosa]|uniref:Hamartin n=1 Tax=Tegillarca granosa TaxID=220873 RepID=A0ABQ9EAY1_TEGGR|nr:hypothetical protein KUTeg_022236 [Tegillarca granosa]